MRVKRDDGGSLFGEGVRRAARRRGEWLGWLIP
jgi:hypothetical protein